jgi:dTDP-4-amino-4,6-dideoxygalactose transaminase
LHRQPAYSDLAGLSFPRAERAAAEVLSLPIYPEMEEAEIDYVIDQVTSHFAQ